jgi:hypothetical protein
MSEISKEYLDFRENQLNSTKFVLRVKRGKELLQGWLKRRITNSKRQIEKRGYRVANNLPIRPVIHDSYGTED